jgi:ATP-dependent protease ClpP protease subunit
MPYIIHINKRFDKALVQQVKNALKMMRANEKEICFRINSLGGNLYAFNVIGGFMYFMHKYRNCKIIGQAVHAESSALFLFLNCTIRQVCAGSTGIIHLPVPNTKDLDEANLEAIRKKAIKFIKSRTTMTEEQIISLANVPLGPHEMLKLGIATEKIKGMFIK